MTNRSSPRKIERGQILVIFALSLTVLLLMGGLVIDAGSVFVSRRDSQNSADIGSMAGTKRLVDYYVNNPTRPFTVGDNAYTAVATRMAQNNCAAGAGSGCSWTARYVGPRTGATFQDLGPVGPNDTAPPGAVSGQKALGIKVDVTKTPPTYLLGLIGQSTWTVQTTATAVSGEPNGAPAGQILPIAMIQPESMTEGSIYALTSGKDAPGNFGWLSWTGSNDPGTLSDSICTPDNPPFVLPWEFPGDPGKSNSKGVRDCLQQWVDNQQVVLIPIVLPDGGSSGTCDTGGKGNGFHYCIVALAAFVITGYAQPAVDQINGRFVGTVPYSVNGNSVVPGGVTAPPATNSHFYYLGLAQ